MSKKLNIVVKLLSCIMALSLCLACFLLVDSPNSVKAEDTQVDASNVLYYVDAGDLSKTEDGQGDVAKYGKDIGYPSKKRTTYMSNNGLSFGTKTEGVISGLYNSVTDQDLGADSETGKTWGYDKSTYSWTSTNPDWFMYRHYETSSTTSGFETARGIESGDGGSPLTYKFEVDDDTTALKVEFGTRSPSGWGQKNYTFAVNGGTQFSILSTETEDKTYSYNTYNTTDGTANFIKGIKDDDKYYITLEFGNAGASVCWILISKLETSLNQTFVSKDANTVTVLCSDGTTADATLTEESKINLANAQNFDSIDITATIDNTTVSGSVIVLPKGTKYFVNFGGSEQEALNIAYSQEKGYGYTGANGKEDYQSNNYDKSIVYGSNQVPLKYQFDVNGGYYEIVIGAYDPWTSRTMTVSLNGSSQSLVSSKDAVVEGVYYADMNNDGAINLEISGSNDNYIVSYILVYEVNKITYNSNGGDAVDPVYFELGSSVILANDLSRELYQFDGWYTEKENGTQLAKGASLSTSQTLYAHWSYIEKAVKTMSVSLNGKIVVNLGVTLASNPDSDAYLSVTVGTNEVQQLKFSDIEKEANGKYYFEVDVAAAQMTEEIKVKAVYNDLTTKEQAFTVQKYAKYLLSLESSTDELKSLLKSMLDYGAYAQTCFNVNTDSLANAGIWGEESSPVENTTVPTTNITTTGTATDPTIDSIDMFLQSDCTLRLYFKVNDISKYSAVLTYNDGVDHKFNLAMSTDETAGYYVDIPHIPAPYLSKDYTITFTNTEDNTTCSVVVSAYAYISKVLSSENTTVAQKNVAKALYLYGESAKAYNGYSN